MTGTNPLTSTAVAALMLALTGMPSWAQDTGTAPSAELGVDLATSPYGDGGWQTIAPRIGFFVNAQTSIELAAAPEHDRENFSHTDYGFARVRRTLHTFDRGLIAGSLGVAVSKQTFNPHFGGPLLTEYQVGPSFGLGVEFRALPRLALRADAEYVMSNHALLRLGAGVSVPFASYPRRLDGQPFERPAAFAPLRTGQTVWVTDASGRNTKGTVASATNGALTLRHRAGATTIAASDITSIDGTDSLANGVLIGTLVGGGAGGGFGAFVGNLWCEGSDGCVAFGALIIAGVGAGVGALSGAIVDSLHERPRRIYDAGTRRAGARLVVAPVVTGRAAGLAGSVRW